MSKVFGVKSHSKRINENTATIEKEWKYLYFW